MTSRLPPQCVFCVHYVSPVGTDSDKQTCAAFPKGIPDEVWLNEADHRGAIKGDRGIQFEAVDGAEFPEYALS